MSSIERSEDGSQLFLVRLWMEPSAGLEAPAAHEHDRNESGTGATGDVPLQCHGKVQHVMSGKAASFNDWPALLDLLLSMMLHDPQPPAPTVESR